MKESNSNILLELIGRSFCSICGVISSRNFYFVEPSLIILKMSGGERGVFFPLIIPRLEKFLRRPIFIKQKTQHYEGLFSQMALVTFGIISDKLFPRSAFNYNFKALYIHDKK